MIRDNIDINLWDYLRIIRKRKKFIILIFGAAILTSAIVTLFSKSVYEVSTTLKIGRVEKQLVMNLPETRELLTSNQLLQETISRLDLNITIHKLREMIVLKDVPESEDLLKIVVRGESPQEITEIAQTLSSFVLKKHQEILNQQALTLQEEQKGKEAKEERQYLEKKKFEKEENQKHQKLLKDLIEDIELDIKEAKEKLRDLPLKTYVDCKVNIINLKRQLLDLQKEYNRTLVNLNGPQKGREILSQPTTIFDPAIKPKHPVKEPRIALNIFLAGIAGLIGGVILALLGDYYTKIG